MSIEEVAKRVRELEVGVINESPWRVGSRVKRTIYREDGSGVLIGVMDFPGDAAFVAELRTLAPQLAEWVEKAIAVMRAMVDAYGVEFFGTEWRTNPTHALGEDEIDRAWSALRRLIGPSCPAGEAAE